MNRLTRLLALIAVLALAVPAAVSANKPDDPGQGKSKKCAPNHKQPKVGFVVRGTYVSGDAASGITLTVTHANKHAKRVVTVGQPWTTPTVDASKVSFGEGRTSATAGDRVKVLGKIAKPRRGCDPDSTLVIKKITITPPEPAEAPQP